MKKQRTQFELDAIKSAWFVDENGNLRWKRKPINGNINDLVGMSNVRHNHRVCVLSIDGKTHNFVESNVVWFLNNGEWTYENIDHIDGNPLNNKIENLRVCNQSENMCNSVLRKDNKSGIKGVYFKNNKWLVQLWKQKKCYNLGTYDSFETAKIVRKLAEQRFHGEFAKAI